MRLSDVNTRALVRTVTCECGNLIGVPLVMCRDDEMVDVTANFASALRAQILGWAKALVVMGEAVLICQHHLYMASSEAPMGRAHGAWQNGEKRRTS